MLLNCTHSLLEPHEKWSSPFFPHENQALSPSCEQGAILWLQSRESELRLHRQGSGTLPGKLPQTHDQDS